MQSLPVDIYSVIFSYINEERDVANVRLVSTRWREYARRYITWIQLPSPLDHKCDPRNSMEYRASILKLLPNLQCPLRLILSQMEDIITIGPLGKSILSDNPRPISYDPHNYVGGTGDSMMETQWKVTSPYPESGSMLILPDLKLFIDDSEENMTDEHWHLFLRYCFDLIYRLGKASERQASEEQGNVIRSKVLIQCHSHSRNYRLIYYFMYDTGTIDFECRDLPGPLLQRVRDSDLGFSYIAPYVNKMGPWILEYAPILRSAFYLYPSITEVSLPYWSQTILLDYFGMLISPSCYITTLSYYRDRMDRLMNVSTKLEEVWREIPFMTVTGSIDVRKKVSLILPFDEGFLHNVINRFPSCHAIGVFIGLMTTFQPEIIANRIQSRYGIQQITFYVPRYDTSKNLIVYPVVPNISYRTYTLE